jgi:hypothetical protein
LFLPRAAVFRAPALGFFLARSIAGVLTRLIGESKRLTEAVSEGKLQTRGNPDVVSLEFRPIVEGTNSLIDAFVAPINVTAEYVDRISKGGITPGECRLAGAMRTIVTCRASRTLHPLSFIFHPSSFILSQCYAIESHSLHGRYRKVRRTRKCREPCSSPTTP